MTGKSCDVFDLTYDKEREGNRQTVIFSSWIITCFFRRWLQDRVNKKSCTYSRCVNVEEKTVFIHVGSIFCCTNKSYWLRAHWSPIDCIDTLPTAMWSWRLKIQYGVTGWYCGGIYLRAKSVKTLMLNKHYWKILCLPWAWHFLWVVGHMEFPEKQKPFLWSCRHWLLLDGQTQEHEDHHTGTREIHWAVHNWCLW